MIILFFVLFLFFLIKKINIIIPSSKKKSLRVEVKDKKKEEALVKGKITKYKKKEEALVKGKITKASKRKLLTNFSQLDKKKLWKMKIKEKTVNKINFGR